MEARHRAEMERMLDARLAAGRFDGRAAVLFGHCNATEEMADYLLGRGVRPAAILDNNAAKKGLSYRGIPVRPPEIMRNFGAGDSVVLIAARFFAEMSAQLGRLGYGGEIVRVVEYNSFAEYSLSAETLERRTARMLRGLGTLEGIRGRWPGLHLIICPNNALGDVYWAMAFLPAYRAMSGVGETAVAVVGEGCRQVAGMFGAKRAAALSPAEMDELVQAVVHTGADDCLIAHHDRPYTDNIIKYLDRHFLSFIDYYRCAVYGLPRETEAVNPHVCEPFPGGSALVKGGSVILAPYAKSVTQPAAEFWESFAAGWRGRGYEVHTNVNGGEQPIRGTLPLTLPLSQMKAAAEYAGVFAGLRSGLCDVVHAANCRRIVVFPDCFYSTTPHKVADFFALPGWERLVWFGL
jgi:hypothetical protein